MQTLQSPIKAKLEIGNIDFRSVEGNSNKTDLNVISLPHFQSITSFPYHKFATLLVFPDKGPLPPPLKVKHEYLHDFFLEFSVMMVMMMMTTMMTTMMRTMMMMAMMMTMTKTLAANDV